MEASDAAEALKGLREVYGPKVVDGGDMADDVNFIPGFEAAIGTGVSIGA